MLQKVSFYPQEYTIKLIQGHSLLQFHDSVYIYIKKCIPTALDINLDMSTFRLITREQNDFPHVLQCFTLAQLHHDHHFHHTHYHGFIANRVIMQSIDSWRHVHIAIYDLILRICSLTELACILCNRGSLLLCIALHNLLIAFQMNVAVIPNNLSSSQVDDIGIMSMSSWLTSWLTSLIMLRCWFHLI